MDEFQSKIAVVTGAGRGIGKAIVDALQKAGAKVAALDMAFIEQRENQFLVDVTDCNAVNKTVGDVENQLGEIDFLVNVAGILRMGSLLECSDRNTLI